VIADLVGVPESDRRMVFDWTEMTFGFDPSVTAEQRNQAMLEMYAYADSLCTDRQENPRDDLLSVLLHAEVDGERLTQLQIDLFFMLLQNAGSETTRNLITTGTLALLQHPDQLELLRSDMSLLPTAIEELLRYVTPVMQFTRHAVTDVELGGKQIRAGDRVLMVYTSANRDETAFENPDGIDITRDPNDHVAFGAGGPHFCLGASLARLESRIMFEAVLTRFHGLDVDGDPATFPRVHSNLIDGYARLPIRWDAVR
jgi:cytochrome P450